FLNGLTFLSAVIPPVCSYPCCETSSYFLTFLSSLRSARGLCFRDRSCLAFAFRHLPRGCSRHPYCLLGGGALPDRLSTARFNSSPECGDSRSSDDQGFYKELSSRKLWSR